MAAKDTTHTSKTYYKLLAKAEKAKDNKVIAKVEKVGEKYEPTAYFSAIEGTLVGAEIKEFVYEGKPTKSFVLEFQDKNGIDHLEFSQSYLAYGIINQLANLDLPREIEISAYIKDGYVRANVKLVGTTERANWKYSPKEQPKPIEFKTPSGDVMKDSANVKKFWLDEFQLIIDKLKSKPVPSIQTTTDDLVPDPIDDLPF